MAHKFDIIWIQDAKHKPLIGRKAIVIDNWKDGVIVNLIGSRGGRQNHPVRLKDVEDKYIVLEP